MITASILNAIETYLTTLPLMLAIPEDPWEFQVTSKEEPFATSGQSIITAYPIRITRESMRDQQIKLIPEVELCFTKRIKVAAYDKQKPFIYSSIPNSLVTLTEILGILLDSNLILTNLISNSIISNKSSIVDMLDMSSENNSIIAAAQLDTLQVIGVAKIAELIIRPIERADSFFTAYNTKRISGTEFGIDRINPAGYSTKIRLRCPEILVNIPC